MMRIVDDGGDDDDGVGDEDGDEDDANNVLPILAARRSRSKRKIIRVKRKVYGKNKVLHGTMTVKDGLNQDKKVIALPIFAKVEISHDAEENAFSFHNRTCHLFHLFHPFHL